ncbi:hypothetical protein F0562_013944 [Nyssa sinensis]|uniref:Uncharacterized protein n=1 Tax=Nyssa sinensis TaxID=561372 RepID=A0A5J4ZRA3_9ASTE|nr:hypothetical protein F0562_013944 [Nyssa sinensis]
MVLLYTLCTAAGGSIPLTEKWAVRDRILKDANGDISDHLRNHIHLTNCIHLKNHMHKHSPILSDRSIMRDLVVLQRSRSLRDPSMSPPSWPSPSVVDLLSKRGEKDVIVGNGRRSVGIERQRDGRGLLRNSPPLVTLHRAKVAPGDVSGHNDGAAAVSERSSKSGVRERRRIKREETSGNKIGTDLIGGNDKPVQEGNDLVHDIDLGSSEPFKDKKIKHKGHREDVHLKTLSEQLNEVRMDGDDVASSHIHRHGKHTQNEIIGEEAETSIRGYCSGLNKVKRRKFRAVRRNRAAVYSRDAGVQNEMSVASNSLGQGSGCRKYHMEEGEEEYAEQNVTRAPRNGCGIPWSRIHHRGKTFLDMAGRSLSCGLSDPRLKKGGPLPCGRDVSDMPAMSDQSSSSTKSEALPLLVEASGSQGSADNAAWMHDYSGELGIFADNLLKHEIDSDLASEARSEFGGASSFKCCYEKEGWVAICVLWASWHRCQKFFFPKLKDADIIYTLQWIANKEDLEIDKDALKLIASRSDGSLRDAEMTLEQLSLLGQRVSVPLVQELVGLICDEKLVDLLDLALSADTVNTVKNLREIMESGVEPLALMSQLATVITDILAGSYDLTKARPRRKFFRRRALSKDDMEKLRQALKTLSEAEKQLRVSNDRLTWLTAALLQLAPDQQYMLPTSSADTSFNHSPLVLSNAGGRERPRKSNVEHAEMPNTGRGLSTDVRIVNLQAGSSSDVYYNGRMKVTSTDRKRNAGVGKLPEQTFTVSSDMNRVSGRPVSGKVYRAIEEIWLEVLEKIQINSIKEFMYQEGKLISVSFGAAPTVQLMFSSHLTKSKAEEYRAHILQAFDSVLGSPVTLEIRCESRKDARAGINMPLILPALQDGSSQMYTNPGLISPNRMPVVGYDDIGKRVMNERDGLIQAQQLQSDSLGMGRSEIVEIVASPREPKGNGHIDNNTQSESTMISLPERRKLGDQNKKQLVKSKVSLAHVIQQAEGCTQRNGWSKRKAVSIAEKLEQENLRLEPRSRSLLCWKASRVTRRKLSRLKIRTRKPRTLLKFVSCGKCLSTKSPSTVAFISSISEIDCRSSGQTVSVLA